MRLFAGRKAAKKRSVGGLTGWIDCFEKARLAGTVFAGGVNGPGETAGHPALERSMRSPAASPA